MHSKLTYQHNRECYIYYVKVAFMTATKQKLIIDSQKKKTMESENMTTAKH